MTNALRAIARWWEPPGFSDADRTERARSLTFVVLLTAAVATIFLGLLVLPQPSTLGRRLVSLLVVFLVATGVQAINRAGRTTLGSWTFVLGTFALLLWRSYTSGGVSSPQSSGFLTVVLMAGVLLGTRAGIWVGIGVWLSALVMVVAERRGTLPPSDLVLTPLVVWLFSGIWIGLALALQHIIASTLRSSLTRYQKELARRKEAQRHLEDSYEALRASEQKFHRLFSAMPAGVLLSTVSEGRILEVNDEFERIFGWKRDEVLGRLTRDIGLGSLRSNGQTRDVALQLPAKDGKAREVRSSFHTLDFAGEPTILMTFVEASKSVAR